MEKIKKHYCNVEIDVFLSKAANQVLNYYKVKNKLEEIFSKIKVEINSNSPFIAGQLQTKKYDFLLIAPATSNTVSKLVLGIADTLLTNAAIMSLKALLPVYIMPSDFKEGSIMTKLPNGRSLKLYMRKTDLDNVKKLSKLPNVFVLKETKQIKEIFQRYYVSPI
jgi:archaeoflavoprotein AfpA